MNITSDGLIQMKNVDIKTVDINALVDINDIHINEKLPKTERILDFISQIKNPYCYKCGTIIIKSEFEKTTDTIEDRLENYLLSL